MDKGTEWIVKHCCNSLFVPGKFSLEKVNKSASEDDNRNVIDDFIREADVRLLVVTSPVRARARARTHTHTHTHTHTPTHTHTFLPRVPTG